MTSKTIDLKLTRKEVETILNALTFKEALIHAIGREGVFSKRFEAESQADLNLAVKLQEAAEKAGLW